MSALWAALLASGAVACLLGLPRPAGLRLEHVRPSGQGSGAGRTAAAWRPGADGLCSSGPRSATVTDSVTASGRPGLRRVLARTVVAVSGFAVVAAVVPGGVVPAVLAFGAGAAGIRTRRVGTVRAARRLERSRAVEACGTLAAELRAGRTPADALQAAAELATGPSRSALAAAAGAARLGGDPAVALRPPDGTAVPEVLRALAACWTVCSGSGSGLAAAVERLEEGLRADQAQRRAVDAELAGPRATAGLLAVLPVTGLLLAAGLGADPLRVLLSTPVGLLCLGGGLLLDATGLWWTGRLVARAGGTG